MVDVNDFSIEKECEYKGERYLVRDNGAVFRLTPEGKKARKLDGFWTFGKKNDKGYLTISDHRVHIIVATAFHGSNDSTKFVVDHIDTNRCNNRPENLRWLTRLENVLRNPITVKKISYVCGSLENFLENPAAYRDALSGNQNFDWMRSVTKEEANATLRRLLSWAEKDSDWKPGGTLGEWIFKDYARDEAEYQRQQLRSGNFQPTNFYEPPVEPEEEKEPELEDLPMTDSLTPNAKQQMWRTPTEFPLCPTDNPANDIQGYFDALQPGEIFLNNVYGSSKVIDRAWWKEGYIVVETESLGEAIKPWALSLIYIKDGFYVHASQGTFFHKDGADKYFTIAQGKEWTGGEVFDDFC